MKVHLADVNPVLHPLGKAILPDVSADCSHDVSERVDFVALEHCLAHQDQDMGEATEDCRC